ncbi:MAG: hypothetical protein WCV62_01965 [Candidatus Peribacteraceae bacterium]|jgi:preprotein translocase subunit SecD
MKRLFSVGVLLLLAGCTQPNTGYTITIQETGTAHAQELRDAAVRVVERRAERLGQKLQATHVTTAGDDAVLRFALQNTAVGEVLTQELTAPFSFRVMVEASKEEADIWHEKSESGYKETGVTEQHISWITATATQDRTRGMALILLTPEGQTLLAQAFERNQGKQMAIFVRDVLMSRKRIGLEDKKGSIQIDNIPSPQVASIFADDVNVGLHVAFRPLASATNNPSSSVQSSLPPSP